jgi:hypothetical protein
MRRLNCGFAGRRKRPVREASAALIPEPRAGILMVMGNFLLDNLFFI